MFTKLWLQDTLYYEQLKGSVIAHDLLVDSLLYKVHKPSQQHISTWVAVIKAHVSCLKFCFIDIYTEGGFIKLINGYINKSCIIFQDVKLTATNDDQYFVFEDYLYQVSEKLWPLFHVSVSDSGCVSGRFQCGRPIPCFSICQTYLPVFTLLWTVPT